MIFGIGTDIGAASSASSRSTRNSATRFVERLLLPAEAGGVSRATAGPVRFLAMRFAAKEAIVKAMGTGFAHGMWIRDGGVVPNAWGKPGDHLVGARPRRCARHSASAKATSR